MAKRKFSSLDVVPFGTAQPNAVEIEANTLGCLMMYPKTYINVCGILSPDAFYKDAHKEIYQSIVNVNTQNNSCDPSMVVNDLDKRGVLDSVGSVFYVSQLTDSVVSDTHIVFWAKTILDKYILRESIRMATDQIRQSYEPNSDAVRAVQTSARYSDLLTSTWISRNQENQNQNPVDEVISDLGKRCENASKGILTGVKTPLRGLDSLLNGFQKTDLIILAARPSMGKTSIAIASAIAAAQKGIPVLFFSLEMSRLQLYYKLLMSLSGVNPERIRTGRLTPEDWDLINKAKPVLNSLPITIDDTPGATPDYIYGTTRQAIEKGKCGIVFIDYLGLINNHTSGNNKDQDIGEITRRMKSLAKIGSVPVVLLCQLSRKVEETPTKKPSLSHLRDSGNIEADADVVMFVYRPEYYGLEGRDGPIIGKGQILVAKHRQGPLGDIFFGYNPTMTKIWDYEEGEKSEDAPF